MGTELAQAPGNALAVADDYAAFAGQGFEGTTPDDFAIPFITILQGLSPQLETVDGAKPGLIINTVTNQLYAALEFILCHTEHTFVEWADKRIVAKHEPTSDVVTFARENGEFGDLKTQAGNELVETFYAYGLAQEPGTINSFAAVIAFASTKIKKYRGWLTVAKSQIAVHPQTGAKFVLPLFAHRYLLKTAKEKNAKGEFYNWQVPGFALGTAVASRLAPTEELFQEAVKVREGIKTGKLKAADEAASKDGGPAAGMDKEIPF